MFSQKQTPIIRLCFKNNEKSFHIKGLLYFFSRNFPESCPMTENYQTDVNSEAIAAAIAASGLTQQRLSARMKEVKDQAAPESLEARGALSAPMLSKLSSGSASRTMLSTVHLLAKTLDVPVESLLIDKSLSISIKQGTLDSSARSLGYVDDLPHIEIPYTSVPARAGFAEMCQSASDYGADETVRLSLPMQQDVNFWKDKKARAFEVDGDSMEPRLESGDIVAAYEIPRERWETISNAIFVVAYADTLTIKAVYENTLFEKQVLTLYPEREGMAPMVVPLSLIRCIYQVDRFHSRATDKIRL